MRIPSLNRSRHLGRWSAQRCLWPETCTQQRCMGYFPFTRATVATTAMVSVVCLMGPLDLKSAGTAARLGPAARHNSLPSTGVAATSQVNVRIPRLRQPAASRSSDVGVRSYAGKGPTRLPTAPQPSAVRQKVMRAVVVGPGRAAALSPGRRPGRYPSRSRHGTHSCTQDCGKGRKNGQ